MKELFAVTLATLALGTAASAQTQTFSLTAQLTYSDLETAELFGSSELTGTLTGQFSFDLSTPSVDFFANAIAETDSYEFIGLTLNVGNQVLNFTSDPSVDRVLEVSNAFGGLTGSTDQISLSGSEQVAVGTTGRTTELFAFNIAGFDLFDDTSLASVALAADPGPGVFVFSSSGGVVVLDGLEQAVTFEEAQITLIPEPSAGLVTILGIAAAGWVTGRRGRGQA